MEYYQEALLILCYDSSKDVERFLDFLVSKVINEYRVKNQYEKNTLYIATNEYYIFGVSAQIPTNKPRQFKS